MVSIDTASSKIIGKLEQYGIHVDEVVKEAGWVVSEDNKSPCCSLFVPTLKKKLMKLGEDTYRTFPKASYCKGYRKRSMEDIIVLVHAPAIREPGSNIPAKIS
jgi:hypothetical protein